VLGRITSEFGYRDHPTKGRHAVHNGVDIGADAGQDVVSFMNGVVEEVGENSDFGKYLFIAHPNGVRTFYAHCSRICVEQEQRVRVGELVAQVGSTGQSTGPHLHFELEMNGTRLDPLHYIEHTGA
jgi:murein DD-endopeptidase MepM/ murein hydrolase activator NlpD